MLATVLAVNDLLTRPFREEVDLETVFLTLALALFAAGAWHLVLEKVEL